MSYNAYTEYGEITKEQVNHWKEQRVIAAARALISTGGTCCPDGLTVIQTVDTAAFERLYDTIAALDTVTD